MSVKIKLIPMPKSFWIQARHFLQLDPVQRSVEFSRLLLAVAMAAVSKAPSTAAHPNGPLPVNGSRGQYPPDYLDGIVTRRRCHPTLACLYVVRKVIVIHRYLALLFNPINSTVPADCSTIPAITHVLDRELLRYIHLCPIAGTLTTSIG